MACPFSSTSYCSLPASTGDGTPAFTSVTRGLRVILLQQILTGINSRNIINTSSGHAGPELCLSPDIQRTCSRGFNTICWQWVSPGITGLKISVPPLNPKTANLLNTGANRCDIPGFETSALHGVNRSYSALPEQKLLVPSFRVPAN